MFQLLYKYLILHKSASVPGIGFFYIERIPASLDFANKVFIAPASKVNFKCQAAGGDNKIYAFILQEQKIGETEAISHFNNFVNNIKKNLEEHKSAELPGLGVLLQNNEGQIHFEAASQIINYFPAASAERLLRENTEHPILVGDTNRTNTQMKEMLVDDTEPLSQTKDHWWIFAIALGLIGIATIFYYYLHNGSLQ